MADTDYLQHKQTVEDKLKALSVADLWAMDSFIAHSTHQFMITKEKKSILLAQQKKVGAELNSRHNELFTE